MDGIDRAQAYSELYHDLAMKEHFTRQTMPEATLIINGVRCCIDCEDPIDPRRLAAQPGAVRCTACASKKERIWKRSATSRY